MWASLCRRPFNIHGSDLSALDLAERIFVSFVWPGRSLTVRQWLLHLVLKVELSFGLLGQNKCAI